MEYPFIPNDFRAGELEGLKVVQLPKDPKAHTDYATRHKVVDEGGNEFLVIADNTRIDDISDHFHISQLSGDLVIVNPTVIKTEMWPSGGDSLAQRAILTAMREFEQINAIH